MRRALLFLILLFLAPPTAHARVITLRAPDGSQQRFRVHRQLVMQSWRAQRRAHFRAYAGVGIDDRTATVRYSRSPIGVHASVRSASGTWYVDPRGSVTRSLPLSESEGPEPGVGVRGRVPRQLTQGGPVKQRTYRLAIASDPSYANAVPGTGTLDQRVNAAKAVLVQRVGQVYSAELGINLVLVADNRLNFNTSSAFTASFPNITDCDGNALNRNQTVVDSKIGSASYDVGQLAFGPDGSGGGIATLGVVGIPGFKAQGCTGLSTPFGDAFAIDYFAHELGHEYDADHTFNGTTGSCSGGTRVPSQAVEPGSGSSIMAYAGICGADNLQLHSDPYFSQRSMTQIQSYVSGNAQQGGSVTTLADHPPVVTTPGALTVPIQTPFTLAGSATDQENDALSYTWEENDTPPKLANNTYAPGIALFDEPKSNGPLFRDFSIQSAAAGSGYTSADENAATAADRVRTFPDPAQIAAGTTDAITGSCLGFTSGSNARIDCDSEFLPASARTLHFRLTARDGQGGVSSGDTTVTVVGTAPFAVTAPVGASVPANTTQTVTWNRGGTNDAPFAVANVSISYSGDGGLTFPTVLTASTPNDGGETVTIPSLTTTSGRIKVAAVGGAFFSVNPLTAIAPEPGPYYDIPSDPVTPTPTAVVTASPEATTPTPTPTVRPGEHAALQPVLTGTHKRLRADRRRWVRVRIGCAKVGAGTGPTLCVGTLRLGGGKTRFVFRPTKTVTRRVRVSRRTYRRLRHHRLKLTLKAAVGSFTASRRVILRR